MKVCFSCLAQPGAQPSPSPLWELHPSCGSGQTTNLHPSLKHILSALFLRYPKFDHFPSISMAATGIEPPLMTFPGLPVGLRPPVASCYPATSVILIKQEPDPGLCGTRFPTKLSKCPGPIVASLTSSAPSLPFTHLPRVSNRLGHSHIPTWRSCCGRSSSLECSPCRCLLPTAPLLSF